MKIQMFIVGALVITFPLAFTACSSTKTSTPAATILRIPAKFDFSPPARAGIGSANATIAIVKPTYVGQNPEYYVSPFNEMATSMGNDFEELLTAKGFSVRGPFASTSEMTFNDKENSSFIFEIAIELNGQHKRTPKENTTTNWGSLLIASAPMSSTTYTMVGEVTLAGNLVINARSPRYGELIWKKSLALAPISFTYTGVIKWANFPQMQDELEKDNVVYNKITSELEKFYQQTLTLAWRHIEPAEMKDVAEQAKKADKKN